jgi:uncharacterized RDD family membrane protein YckC
VQDRPATTLASPWRRLAARLVDGALLVLVTVLPLLLFADVHVDQGAFDLPGWLQWSTWLAAAAYEVLLTALTGQTVGKRLLGIKVVDATTGAVPDLDQSVRRAVPVLLQRVPIIGGFAGLLYLPVVWRPRRQGFHDTLAGTVVVDVDVDRAARPDAP